MDFFFYECYTGSYETNHVCLKGLLTSSVITVAIKINGYKGEGRAFCFLQGT